MKLSKKQSLIVLHIIIFVWGFTGILGELINMQSIPLVFNRMILAFFSLAIFELFLLKIKMFLIRINYIFLELVYLFQFIGFSF